MNAPIAGKNEEEMGNFYNDLQKTLYLTISSDITVVMREFNAKIGEGKCAYTVESNGLG